MAPERHAGRDAETVDVYGLGLVLFNLLTGKEHPELPPDEEAQPAFRDALALRAMEALGARRRVSELVAALVALAQTAVARPPAPSAEMVQPALALEPPAPSPSAPAPLRRPAQIAVTHITPAQSAARVSVQGDATRVELLTRGEPIALPAEVAPGTYSVLVTFPTGDRPFVNGELTVRSGAAYEIRCLFAMLTCTTRELP